MCVCVWLFSIDISGTGVDLTIQLTWTVLTKLVSDIIAGPTLIHHFCHSHTSLYLWARWEASFVCRHFHWETLHSCRDHNCSAQAWRRRRSSQPLHYRVGLQAWVSCFDYLLVWCPSTCQSGTAATYFSASWGQEVASTGEHSPPGPQDRLWWRASELEWQW